MNKKISLGLALSLVAISIAVTFILTSFFSLQSYNEKVVDVNAKSKKYSALQAMDTQVRKSYYGNITENKLNVGILKGYVNGLDDKYSRFLSAEEYLSQQNIDSGMQFGGFTLAEDESGYIRISSIVADCPAYSAGLREGDIITAVGDVKVIESGFDAAVDALNGTEGSEVKLTVRRDGFDKTIQFTRSNVELITASGEMLAQYIGYISLTGFKNNTPDQFISILERLTTNGAKSLVIDLRNNIGGTIDALQQCLDPLLPEGVAVSADYTDDRTETVVYSDASELDLPIVVIVNEKTTGEGELFAAALRDAGKAKIVGSRTYGKGLMQETIPFDNGTAVILTVAEYYTPVTGKFNGKGITPDIIAENDDMSSDFQYFKAIETLREWDQQ